MSDPAFADNPWSFEHWNLTRQGQYIRKYGLEVAKTKAKQAGTAIGAPRPKGPIGPYMPLPQHRNFTVIVQRKGNLVNVSGGGLVGAGSSGEGPPT